MTADIICEARPQIYCKFNSTGSGWHGCLFLHSSPSSGLKNPPEKMRHLGLDKRNPEQKADNITTAKDQHTYPHESTLENNNQSKGPLSKQYEQKFLSSSFKAPLSYLSVHMLTKINYLIKGSFEKTVDGRWVFFVLLFPSLSLQHILWLTSQDYYCYTIDFLTLQQKLNTESWLFMMFSFVVHNCHGHKLIQLTP